MNGLRGAVGLLTILPVGRGLDWQGAAMVPWFPVVGLILGGLWVGFDALAGWAFPPALRAGLDVLCLMVLTGGLHMDGLADTADGILSHRGKEKALDIMKDSRIGAWGVLAVVSVLALKGLALSGPFLGARWLSLLLVPAYGRLAMVLAISVLPYGRGKEGIASDLFQGKRAWAWVPGAALVGVGSAFLGWPGILLINGAFLLAVVLVLSLYRSRMGCVTGDMLGALGEVTETALLVSLAVRW
jgi:adenosylcobinamide-GDP ribazoletransferase